MRVVKLQKRTKTNSGDCSQHSLPKVICHDRQKVVREEANEEDENDEKKSPATGLGSQLGDPNWYKQTLSVRVLSVFSDNFRQFMLN